MCKENCKKDFFEKQFKELLEKRADENGFKLSEIEVPDDIKELVGLIDESLDTVFEWVCAHVKNDDADNSKKCEEKPECQKPKELVDSIDLMLSSDYKNRFRGEYMQLMYRLKKLETMLHKYKNGLLNFEPDCPYELLKEQYMAMEQYAKVLRERATLENIKL